MQDLGFLRADGKTLIAQPHLDDDGLWTLDDVRSMQYEIVSPNIAFAEQMGLANGSSANGARRNGAAP